MQGTRGREYWHALFDNPHMNEFYLSTSLRWFGLSLFLIFIPGYFYSLGYSLRVIALIAAISAGTHALAIPLVARIAQKKVTLPIMLSVILNICIHWLFLHLQDNVWYILILPVLYGLTGGFFWLSYHLIFVLDAEKKSQGRKISAMTFIAGVFTMIAPAAGGLILDYAGLSALIVIIIVFLVLSLAPLLFLRTSPLPHAGKINLIAPTKQIVGYVAFGFANISHFYFWPLYLFIILKSYTVLGIIALSTSFFALMVNLVAGIITDKKGSRRVLRSSALVESLLWLLRLFSVVPLFAVIIDACSKSVKRTYYLAIDARSYEHAHDPLNGVIVREFWLNMGGAIAALLIAVVPTFSLAFVLAALGGLWSYIL